jgi:diaminohydroxyphosphoribosylaminopyrimidine deaminase/5-amino-6-(5-phosphoribosylamino)uracil reductase
VETLVVPDGNGRVDLAGLMRALAARGANEVHVESGGRLNGALLRAGLVDEFLVYIAPALLGDPARGMLELPAPLTTLAERVPLAWHAVERVGADLRVIARVVPAEAG